MNIPTMLLGRWRPEYESDDGRSEYEIFLEDGQLKVIGRDFGDGESYVISDLDYDADRVEFDVLQPSTRRTGHLRFTGDTAGNAVIECTFTYVSEASRRDEP